MWFCKFEFAYKHLLLYFFSEDSSRHLGFLSLPGSRILVAAGEEVRSRGPMDKNRQHAVRNIPGKKQSKDMFVENINEISAEFHHTKKPAPLLTTEQQKASVIRNPDDQENHSQRCKFDLDNIWNPHDVVCLSGFDEISDTVVELSDVTMMSDVSSEIPLIRPIQFKRHDLELHDHNVVSNSYSGDCHRQYFSSNKSEAETVTEVEHVLPCVEFEKVRRIQLPRPVSVVTEGSMLKLFDSVRSSSDFQGFSEASDSIIDEMSYCEVSQATFDTDLYFDCLEKPVSGCVPGLQLLAPSSDDDVVLEDAPLRHAGNDLVSKEKTLSPKSYSSVKSSFSAVEPLLVAQRVHCADTLSVEASQNSSCERSIALTENLRYSKSLSWQPKVNLVPLHGMHRSVDDRSSRICRNSRPHICAVQCDNRHENLDGSFNRIHENTTNQCCITLEIGHSCSTLKQKTLPEDDNSKIQMNRCQSRNKKKCKSEYEQLCSLTVPSEGLLSHSDVDAIININSETSSTSLYQLVDRKDGTFTSITNTKGNVFPVASTSFIEIKPKKQVSARERVFDEDDILGLIENSEKADSCLRSEICTDEKESVRFSLTSAEQKLLSPAYRVCHKRKWQPSVVLEDFMLTQTKR